MQTIYSYSDYKAFILDKIQSYPSLGRGVKTSLAKAVQCQKPYLTHVLKGEAHFNADQTILAANFFALDSAETDYLLHLVLSARADQKELKAYYQTHLEALLNQYYLMKNRVQISSAVSTEFKNLYYSSWHFSAIHMLTTIPEYRTLSKIAVRLSLSESKIKSVLDVLINAKLLENKDAEYIPTENVVFLGSDENQVVWHHRNWRHKAIEYIERNETNNLHTSFVVTLSQRDFIQIREQMKTAISEAIQKVKTSKEEKIACLLVDFFAL